MKRREFLRKGAALAAATAAPEWIVAQAREAVERTGEGSFSGEDGPLIISAPMLQNYAEASIGVAFAVSDMANGYVIIGEREDLSDGRKVLCGGFRVTDMNDKVMLVRLTRLKSATKYYYRIGADRISYEGGYKMKILGNEEDPRTYSFTTAGKDARAHFCVINDTHIKMVPFGLAIEKIASLSPSCVVWNGDACTVNETVEEQVKIFLDPDIDRKDYAARIPYLFCPGNHDDRGFANRHLERVWMFRQPEERSSRDWDLGRNFAVRMGDIALIGLDTGEDKVDTNPLFAGLFNNTEYRKAQTLWLKDALKRKEIRSAPYLVAFCHIPLFDDDPLHNPGDVYPNDTDPRYTLTWAEWQRPCARMWTPLLEKAGCQLIITGHQHRYRYDAPTKDRPWGQIVGGGPEMGYEGKGEKRHPDAGKFPTVVEGKVENGKLRITTYNLMSGQVLDNLMFNKRKKR